MTRRRLALAAVTVGLLACTGLFLGTQTMAGRYEEPSFTVERTLPGFEVRRYAPTIEAQVTVPGAYGQAVNRAFRVLAGYIFGGNAPSQQVAMTTPVSAAPAGQQISMTSPVSAAASEGGWTVAFTMPSSWTIQTLPRPNDERVKLVTVPGGRWAVRPFGGRARDAVVDRELAALRHDVAEAGLSITGPPVVSQFDPPWVLGWFRRNEVRVPLAEPAS